MSQLRVFHYRGGPEAFPDSRPYYLSAASSRSFQVSLSDGGSARVVVQADDPEADEIEPGDVIAFDIDGVRAFAMLCQSYESVTVDPDGEAKLVWIWQGPSHLAVLKRGLIGPPGGEGRDPIVEDITFDYTHPEYDDSGWVTATEITTVATAKVSWPVLWADDMPDGVIVGPSSGTITNAPAGTIYLRDAFPSPYDGGHLLIWTVDNTGKISTDGKPVSVAGGSGNVFESGFVHATTETISLSDDEHTIALEVTNLPQFGPTNPIGVASQIFIYGFPPTLVWEATDTTKILAYPAEYPGMTFGNAFRLALEAEQAQGRLLYVSLSFDDANDTDGNPWPVVAISTKIGIDLYSFIVECARTHCDVEMDPSSWVLNAWVWGAKNPDSGVTMTPGVNLTSLHHTGEDTAADELLIRWSGGWAKYGSGAVHAPVELGPQNTAEEIARIGERLVALHGNPREQRTLTWDPASDTEVPFVNPLFVTGADITTPDRHRNPTTDRVMELGASQDDSVDRAVFTATVKDVLLQEQERVVVAVTR